MKINILKSVFLLMTVALLASCDVSRERSQSFLVPPPPDLSQQDNVQNNYFTDRSLVAVWGDYNPNDTRNQVRLVGVGGRSEYVINYTFSTLFVDKFRLLQSRSESRNSFCNQQPYLELSLINTSSGMRMLVEEFQDINLEKNRNYIFQVRHRPGCNSVDWVYTPIVWLGQ